MSIYTRVVFAAVALFALAILVHNALHFGTYVDHLSSVIVRFIAPLIIAGLMGIAFRLSIDWRLMIANVISAAVLSLYVGEFYIAWKLDHTQQAAAARAGSAFDARTKLSVVRDLRTDGIDAYPIIRGRNLLTEDTQGHLQPLLSASGAPLLPLTATPRTTVVACNESGQWMVYETDRHGFNNPDALWDGPAPQIAMIGDSFTHGSCVSRDQNMASILQRRFGATLNLGVGGDGPLLELAALTEYAEPMRPKMGTRATESTWPSRVRWEPKPESKTGSSSRTMMAASMASSARPPFFRIFQPASRARWQPDLQASTASSGISQAPP